MKPVLAVLCAAAVLAAQTPEPPFRLIVIRGENAQNNIKKGRATRQVVEVRDRNDKPVAGILLTFTLPKTGPGGAFVDGSQITTVTTNEIGQAGVSVQPNSVAGSFTVDVSGNVNGQAVSAQIAQTNLPAAGGISAVTVGVIVAAAAGAAVGIAFGLSGNNNNSSATPATPGLRIGVGSGISILPPR